MSTLVSRVLSHTDKLAIINNASSWLPHSSKKEEAMSDRSSRRSSIEDYTDASSEIYNGQPHRFTPPGSPRYSMAPPPYENVLKESQQSAPIENKRFSNTLSTIWKRASFSSSGGTAANDIKMTPQATQIDKKQMEHALTLINIATDMNNSGNQQMAMDLYMMGLDKLVSALPLESDPSVKSALERKMVELKDRHQMNLISLNDLINNQEDEENGDEKATGKPIRSQLSNLVINAAVLSAVALKKSPIPDAFSNVINYAVGSMQVMDEKHQIRKRTWDFATTSVAKAVEIDRQLEIHQMVTEAFYTGFTAFVKAGMAYAETPGHSPSSATASDRSNSSSSRSSKA